METPGIWDEVTLFRRASVREIWDAVLNHHILKLYETYFLSITP
jgi:hypothetical protein